MKLIGQSVEILTVTQDAARLIELAGRTCYKSEAKITPESAAGFIRGLIKSGHLSVIEHAAATVRYITNRGVTHEMVRHRIAAFSQESTRYVDYGGKEDIEFIRPVWIPADAKEKWVNGTHRDIAYWIFYHSCKQAEHRYRLLLRHGWLPEQAREVLPNALKTEIVMTCNMREWRHVLNLRTAKAAHPQIRALMKQLLHLFKQQLPEFFFDMEE